MIGGLGVHTGLVRRAGDIWSRYQALRGGGGDSRGRAWEDEVQCGGVVVVAVVIAIGSSGGGVGR